MGCQGTARRQDVFCQLFPGLRYPAQYDREMKMTTWHVLVMGDGVQANRITRDIQEAFAPIYIELGQPAACAVFSVNDIEKNIVLAYFTPEAAELAGGFGATPCDPPAQTGGIGLLVGREYARAKYFG